MIKIPNKWRWIRHLVGYNVVGTKRDKKIELWSYFAFAKPVTFSELENLEGETEQPSE